MVNEDRLIRLLKNLGVSDSRILVLKTTMPPTMKVGKEVGWLNIKLLEWVANFDVDEVTLSDWLKLFEPKEPPA